MSSDWESDLEDVQRRRAALDHDALVADARRSVVEWREVRSYSTFFMPLPVLTWDLTTPKGHWARAGFEGQTDAVGLDREGRPAAHVLDHGQRYERAKHLWWWEDDGSLLEIEFMGSGPHVRRGRAEGGRITWVVATDGDGGTVWRVRWADGLPLRADGARGSYWERRAGAFARVAEWEDGRLLQVRDAREEPEYVDEATAEASEFDIEQAGLEDAINRAEALVPRRVIYDARFDATEPWVGTDGIAPLIDPLVAALEVAVPAAVEASGVADPFAVEVVASRGYDHPGFPGAVLVASTRFRNRMRARSTEPLLGQLWRGVESGDVVTVSLEGHIIGAEALRACRLLSTAMAAASGDGREAQQVAGVVGDELARRLGSTLAELGYATLVSFGDPYSQGTRSVDRALRRARAASDPEVFDAWLAETAPVAPPPPSVELAQAARQDRGALRDLLIASGVGTRHSERLADEVAATGLRLEPQSSARSRLGGPAVLPPGVTWPRLRSGAPLSFIAALDLAELPHVAPLPHSGWLLFFACIADDEDALIDEAGNADGSAARVFFVAGGATPISADLPADLTRAAGTVLTNTPVRAIPLLTLPDGWDAPAELGLDVYAAHAYERAIEALGETDEHVSPHWVGGHATGAQGHSPEDDTFLLLSLGWDDRLGFEFLDGGTIQFRIPVDALINQDWSQAVALVESS